MERKRSRIFAALVLSGAMLAAACSSGGEGSTGATGPAGPSMPVIQSLYATGAPASPGGTITAKVIAQSAEGLALTYSWSVSTGWVIASGQTTSTISITAPGSRGASGTATVTVTDSNSLQAVGAVPLSTVAEGAPVAVPGANQYVLPNSLVWLDGSGSFDQNGDGLAYAWSFVSNPSNTSTLSSSTAANPDFYADALGRYVISLMVSDGTLSSAPETVTVTARVPVPDTGQTMHSTSTFGEDADYAIHPLSYTDNGDGTIRDNVTGLTWQKGDAVGYSWCEATGRTDSSCTGNTTNVCGSLTLAGGGWRLPTLYELETIVAFGTYMPAINSAYFPNTQAGYWSSSPKASGTGFAWLVDFGYGFAFYDDPTNTYAVRCVR